MKRLLLTMLLVIVVAVAFYGTANAMSGVCSSCHTMHSSQDGVSGTPNDQLLLSSTCLGCHTGGAVPTAPKVDKATDLLSGGSFADSLLSSDTQTHNVNDLTTFEAGAADHLGNTPPGGGFTLGAPLKCAGANGCHGNHDAGNLTSTQGINGMHHASKTTYKFLKIGTNNTTAGAANVEGQAADYFTVGDTATNHNIYVTGANGISMFCNNCHDLFHGTATTETGGDANLWNRHPTDVALTTLANYASATIDYANTPFAFTSGYATGLATTNATGYDAANGQVMCLSCHRAHASGQPDLLRFTYNMNAGGGGTTGCLACHVNQR